MKNISSIKLTIAVVCFIASFAIQKLSAQNMSGGGYHTLFLCSNGTVMATGSNAYGKLGDGTDTARIAPVLCLALNNITSVAAGFEHSLALKSDGTVWSFGRNTEGQLGHGNNTLFYFTPTQIASLSNITAISGGTLHSLMLKNDGTVWACGYNFYGELGNGTNTDSYSPVQVSSLTNVIAIEAAENTSYALKSDGTIWAWGINIYGQLGDSTNNNSNVPVQVYSSNTYVAISAHHEHVLALKNDSTVWAWGRNTAGELGNSNFGISNYPQQVDSLSGIFSIETGGYYSLVLKNDGTVWAFGENNYGQFGDGTNTPSTIPVQVTSLTSCIPSISTGFWIGMAFENPNSTKVWGYNFDGQLGNGTTTDTNTPVSPVGLCPIALPASNPCGLTAINETETLSGISIYPNPFSASVTVNTIAVLNEAVIQLFDATGKIVYQKSHLSGNLFVLQPEDLEAGIYFLIVKDDRNMLSRKLIVTD